jgi:hypothetical protein
MLRRLTNTVKLAENPEVRRRNQTCHRRENGNHYTRYRGYQIY